MPSVCLADPSSPIIHQGATLLCTSDPEAEIRAKAEQANKALLDLVKGNHKRRERQKITAESEGRKERARVEQANKALLELVKGNYKGDWQADGDRKSKQGADEQGC